MNAAYLTGWGSYLSEASVSSAVLDQRHGLPPGTVEAACGVRTRPLADGAEDQVFMAAKAAAAALGTAAVEPESVDLILFAGAVGYQPIPATAPFVKRAIGAVSAAPAYDINATCLGALVALDHAKLMVGAGRARRVLVVAAEIASRALPWPHAPGIAGLFGDGAGAWVVCDRPGDGPAYRLDDLVIDTLAEGADYCALRSGGTRIDRAQDAEAFDAGATFEMDGRALYRLSTSAVPTVIGRALTAAAWRADELDLVVPHQASPGALAWLERRCGFAKGAVWNEVATTGNLVAASLPVAFDHAVTAGRASRGDKIMVLGTSAGVSIGAMTMAAL